MRATTAAAAAAALAFVAGCGGGERQDADVKAATYTVDEPAISFPRQQDLAEESVMTMRVRNAGEETIPNLAVTVEAAGEGTESAAFGTLTDQPGQASRSRPVWIVDEATDDTAYANTWALGPVPAGRTAEFRWHLTSVKAGRWRISWRLAGGLGNKAKVELDDGEPARGELTVDVSRKPGQARVDENGDVVRVSGRDFDENSR